MTTASYKIAPYPRRICLKAGAPDCDRCKARCKAFQSVILLSLESLLLAKPQLHQDPQHPHRLLPLKLLRLH